VDIEPVVLHEMPDGKHVAPAAPLGDPAEHRASPRLGARLGILILGRSLRFAREREEPRHVTGHPADAARSKSGIQLRAPVTRCLGLVVEITGDGRAEILAETRVVRVVHGADEPRHAIPAHAVYGEAVALFETRRGHPRKNHHLPRRAVGGSSPRDRPFACQRSQVHKRVGDHRPALFVQAAGHECDKGSVLCGIAVVTVARFEKKRLALQPLRGVLLQDLARHGLAGPPVLVKDPHLQVVPYRRIQTDAEVTVPSLAQPLFVRARLGGERAVAAFRHFVQHRVQPFRRLIPVQPEQRPGVAPRRPRQLAEPVLQRIRTQSNRHHHHAPCKSEPYHALSLRYRSH